MDIGFSTLCWKRKGCRLFSVYKVDHRWPKRLQIICDDDFQYACEQIE